MQIHVFHQKTHRESAPIQYWLIFHRFRIILQISWPPSNTIAIMVTHVQNICAAASRTLGYLRRNLKAASPDIKKLAYITFIRPKLEYASSIWHPSQAYLAADLEAVQNRAVRFISSCYSRKTSITALKHSLAIPSLESRRIISRLCLLHHFYYHPRTRHEKLQPPHRTSSRLSHDHSIARINCRTLALKSSFFPDAIALWNGLPNTIASCTNRTSFRDKLNDHFSWGQKVPIILDSALWTVDYLYFYLFSVWCLFHCIFLVY